MTITKNVNGGNVEFKLEGRLDTTTAPELDEAVRAQLPTASEMTLDLTGLVYCSSAGLRVMLAAHKGMAAKGGKLIVSNANDTVQKVFAATGLNTVLNLQ